METTRFGSAIFSLLFVLVVTCGALVFNGIGETKNEAVTAGDNMHMTLQSFASMTAPRAQKTHAIAVVRDDAAQFTATREMRTGVQGR